MNNESNSRKEEGKWRRRLPSLMTSAIFLAVGLSLAVWFASTRPTAKPRERAKVTPIVDVAELRPESVQVRIEAMGTVDAADEAELQSEVSGRVKWVHAEMIEGGLVKEGEVLVKLDDREFRLALTRSRTGLQEAQSALKLERGKQTVAAAEWRIFHPDEDGADVDPDLGLRKPQLESARAAVESARAAVSEAELDLERSSVRAPFNAVVAEADVDVGDRAAPGVTLARLISTDAFLVRASVRVDQLKWLSFPSEKNPNGSKAEIEISSGDKIEGRLIKLEPELDPAGRMARVVVEVQDPLGISSGEGAGRPMLLGDFVRVTLLGKTEDNVIRVSRSFLRDGARLWLLDRDSRLLVVQAKVIWSTAEEVFVANEFEEGARLVISFLGAPVEGMTLTAEEE